MDFWLLRRRLAGASQGEKGKKRQKDTLSGVLALVNGWYYYIKKCPFVKGERQNTEPYGARHRHKERRGGAVFPEN